MLWVIKISRSLTPSLTKTHIISADVVKISSLRVQVLGDYNRQNKSAEELQKFIKEIESISSQPLRDHFFNVSDEVALLTIVDALGRKIFALEGEPENAHEHSFTCPLALVLKHSTALKN